MTLALTGARLGTPAFFACAAAAAAAYASVVAPIWRRARSSPASPTPLSGPDRRLFLLALAFAVIVRMPLAAVHIGAGNDMFRYVWDGRVQRLGYNPYAVRPADPLMAGTHVDDTTRLMPSRELPTFYPPAAQLFFRLVVTVRDSVYAMKLALVACDLLTILLVWRWLLASGRSEWLAIAYAWNPLVVLETAFSGHIDILCALWIAACAYCLARRWTAAAAAALALAVASKLLPIVLAPLLWRRIRARDAAVGLAVLAAIYLPFTAGANPLDSIGSLVQGFRFNGPLFAAVEALSTPRVAAAAALVAGLVTAAFCRFRLAPDHPSAWGWPMAVSLAFAPVIYPWYLISMTPFLLLPPALPLIAWSLSVMAAYVVWERALAGAPWVMPLPMLIFEYGIAIAAGLAGSVWKRLRHQSLQ